jgi:Kef-type K+ transport system membrane component KefB
MLAVALIAILGLLMRAAGDFAADGALGGTPAATTLAFGYLLLTAFLVGGVFKRLRLPRLTGYLATGIITGPEVLGLVPAPQVENLRIFNGVAIALIALTAGAEVHLKTMRPLVRSMSWITAYAVFGTSVLLFGFAVAVSPLVPFLQQLDFAETIAAAAVLAITMVAQAPAVVVALRDEMASDGPLTRTVLGVVLLADIAVVVAFGVASSLARLAFGGDASVLHTARLLGWELGGSAVTGVLVGIVLSAYLRVSRSGGGMFVVVVAFIVAEVGLRLQFDPLLVALCAGGFIRNATSRAERLHDAIASASLPVYVTFFAVAGAAIHVRALASIGPIAACFALVRGFGFLAGTRAAARRAGAPEVVYRYGGFGLLPQAGIALALGLILARTFPELGDAAAALVFGVVALNELVGPVLLRVALVRSGEAGAAGSHAAAASPPAALADPPAPASSA